MPGSWINPSQDVELWSETTWPSQAYDSQPCWSWGWSFDTAKEAAYLCDRSEVLGAFDEQSRWRRVGRRQTTSNGFLALPTTPMAPSPLEPRFGLCTDLSRACSCSNGSPLHIRPFVGTGRRLCRSSGGRSSTLTCWSCQPSWQRSAHVLGTRPSITIGFSIWWTAWSQSSLWPSGVIPKKAESSLPPSCWRFNSFWSGAHDFVGNLKL